MAGKKQKKRNSKDSTASSNGSGEKGGGKKGKGKKSGKKGSASAKGKSSKYQGDMLSEAAMENAYLVCHNIMDVLKTRGFPWPDAQKKKKKGGKKR